MQGDRISAALDRFSVAIGTVTSWLTLAIVLVTCAVVIMRYVFQVPIVWLQESITWMHAAVFMLGAAYTLQCDEHVRVDIFYRDMSERRRAWVDLLGVVLFVVPLCAFLAIVSVRYVVESWTVGEVSRDAGGLPYPFLPLMKSMLIVMPVTVFLQGLSMGIKAYGRLRRR